MGELIYENERAAAFADLNPQAKTHILVVPKDHYANIVDGVPSEVLADMVEAVEHVTQEAGIRESGFRVIMNTGDDAGQMVHHLHMHVLGGEPLGEGLITR